LADLGEETTYGRVPNVNERTTAIMIIVVAGEIQTGR